MRVRKSPHLACSWIDRPRANLNGLAILERQGKPLALSGRKGCRLIDEPVRGEMQFRLRADISASDTW
jgi:hypothetical protein